MKVKPSRSIAKALTWRVIASLITIALVYIVTGELTISIGVGIVEITVKILFYYFHERLWDKISWGRMN